MMGPRLFPGCVPPYAEGRAYASVDAMLAGLLTAFNIDECLLREAQMVVTPLVSALIRERNGLHFDVDKEREKRKLWVGSMARLQTLALRAQLCTGLILIQTNATVRRTVTVVDVIQCFG